MTNSSTSKGWSQNKIFKEDEDNPIQDTIRIEIAQSHAMRLLKNGIKGYSQWFSGKENDVADALSRDDNRSDEELIKILKLFILSQLPDCFKIVPLSNKTSLWLTSLLLKLPVKEQLQERHMRTKLGCGADSENSATILHH